MTEVGRGQLQSQVAKLLDRLGIVYIRSRTDKRSRTQAGTPDFIFASWTLGEGATPVAWEIKLPKKKLRADQEKMRERMESWPNAWRYSVITSVDEAVAELKAMGLVT